MNDFESWLKQELAKPAGYDFYDPNGSSQRAIATRGLIREIAWQYKDVPRHVKSTFGLFDGFETPISWFLQIPFYLALLPVLPVFWGAYTHRRALNAYRAEFTFK